ncbi:hypothetical protein AGMMS49992_06970 [Clostridia bacterium]|nr:hypothetical protein AGMMS49992_06970 [Clostridia bacterium]
MSIRIAVATSDGKLVNQHFGRCSSWTILDVWDVPDKLRDAAFRFVERRDVASACGVGGHSDDALQNAVTQLSDCHAVIVSRIGPGAAAMLESHGIAAFEFGGYIDDAVKECGKAFHSDSINSERVNVV